MKRQGKAVHWIKWRTKETIYGSFMTEPISSLGFVVKMCCLSAETRYPGYIQSEPAKGIPHIQLAALLNMTSNEFEQALELQKETGRVEESENGVIKIVNWDRYQSIPSWDGENEGKAEEEEDITEPESTDPVKRYYGEFKNVLLTDEEHSKLVLKFGVDGCNDRIETLSAGIESKGYKYKSHYATILSWDKKDQRDAAGKGKPINTPQPGKYSHMKPGEDEVKLL